MVSSLDADAASTSAVIAAEERAAHQQQLMHDATRGRRRTIKYIALAILLVTATGIALLQRGNGGNNLNNQADASQRFPVTSIPLVKLSSNNTALKVGDAQTLSVNGQLNVNNSIVLSPTTQPSGALTGQLYYDQDTNRIAFFNGSSFQTLLTGKDVTKTSIGGASGTLSTGGGLSVSGATLSNTGVLTVGGASGNIAAGKGVAVKGGTLNNTGVLTLQGESGNVTLAAGPGIVINGTTLSSSGVISLGGQHGSIAVGSGLSASGGTLRNTGIISATGAGLITVTNDGNGNITIDGPSGGSGSGTVASPGGTTDHLAKFTGVQTIADSIISDDGSTVTVGGNLSVTGSVTLSSPLSVSQGGTGIGTLPTNSVLVGNGTSAVGGISAGSSGLCLVSTAGAPAFQTCPGSGGVASINSLTGALTIAGVSAGSVSSAGSTITLNDASAATKGLASFNATNLTVTSGNVNTVQGISTSATPTFGQLTLTSSQATGTMLSVNNTNAAATGNLLNLALNGSSKLSVSPAGNLALSGTVNGQTIGSTSSFTGGVTVGGTLSVNTISPTGALTVGVGSQALTLQGNASSALKATSGASTTTVGFQSPTANVTYNFATAVAGNYDICTTAGNCVGVGGGVTTSGGTANALAKFTGSGTIGNSIITDNGSTVTVGGTLSVNTLTPTGALTVGSGSENLTLQGAAVSLKDSSAGITNSLVFAVPSASNKTITLPNASGTVAVSASGPLSLDASGNLTCPTCLTSGGSGGTAGVSSINSQTGDIILQGTSAGSVSTVGTTITINDATSAIKGLASFNATNLTVTSGNVNTVQDIAVSSTPTFAGLNLSAALTVGNGGTGATSAAGALTNLGAAASGANSDITSLSGLTTALSVLQGGTGAASLAANGVLVGNGTSPVSSVTGTNGQCLLIVAGTPAFGACPGSGGVASLDALSGALTINNSSGSGSAITINDAAADGATKGIAAFNGTNFTAVSGVINTVQDIGTGASPSFAGLSLTSSPLGVGSGGTGLGTLSADGILYASGTGTISQLGVGTSSQCLISNGAGLAPSWQACPGGGSITGSGTSGKIALFNGTSTLTSSDITDTAGTSISIASGVSLQAQGTVTFKNATDSTTAFQVQDHLANVLLGVDTSGDKVNIGATGTTALASTINIGTSSANPQTIAIGSTAGSSSTSIQSGSGGILISASTGNSISIGTSNSDNITIGKFSGTNPIVFQGFGISQTLTGLTTNPASDVIKTSSNSTMAFQVQNSSGYSILNVSTSNNTLSLGNKTATAGQGVAGNLAFADGTTDNAALTLNTATLSGSGYTLSLPATGASGTNCLQSTSGSTTSATVLTFGSCGVTGSFINNATSVQSANFFVQAASSGSVAGVLQANAAGTGDILDLKNGSGTNVVTFSSTGAELVEPSTNTTNAFQVKDSGNNSVFNIDTTNQQVGAFQNSASTAAPLLTLTQGGSGDSTIALQNSAASSAFYMSNDSSNSNTFTIGSYAGATATTATPTSVQATATASASSASTTSLAFGSNNTAGNTIIVAAQWANTGLTPTCSDTQGNVYATMITGDDPTVGSESGICYASNIKAGANTVTVSYGGPVTSRTLAIHEYSGIAASNPVDNTTGNYGTGTTSANSYTSNPAATRTNGDLIFGYLVDNSGVSATASAGTGFTLLTNNTTLTSPVATEGMVQSTAGTIAATFSENSKTHTYVDLMVAFRPAIGSGSLTNTNNNGVFTLSQTGQATLKNVSNSTTAFQIQNAAGSTLFVADTANNCVGIGGACAGKASALYIPWAYQGSQPLITVGSSTDANDYAIGIDAYSYGDAAIRATSVSGNGLQAFTQNADGIYGYSTNGTGIEAESDGGVAIYGHSNGGDSAYFQSDSTTTSAATATVVIQRNSNSQDNLFHVENNTGAMLFNIAYNGTQSQATGDYAEYFHQAVPGQLQAGDVACLDAAGAAQACAGSSNGTLLGVVSTDPAITNNASIYDGAHPENTAVIAMVGQVPVHASNANGAIHTGDLLTFDPATGLAVKATNAGMTIGEALEDFDGATGTISIYIHIGYYDPMGLQSDGVSNGYVLQGGDATVNNLTVNGTATVSVLNVTGGATIASLTVTTSLSTADITINGHIVTGGATPTTVAGTAAGSGASVSVSGNDESGKLTITLGSGASTGDLLNLTFAKAYAAAPDVVLSAGNDNAAKLQQYVQPTATGFSVNAATITGLTTGQTYTFYYHVMQ